MPKKRKTRKQKLQASMRYHTVSSTAIQSSSGAVSNQQVVKIPEKFSLQTTMQNNVTISHSHDYLKKELVKTTLLSSGIIIGELLLFFLLRNHLVVLFN